MIRYVCEVCGKGIFTYPRKNPRRFCCMGCMSKAFTGSGSPVWKGGIARNKRIYNKFYVHYPNGEHIKRLNKLMEVQNEIKRFTWL
jgi:hypothetical protein